MRELYFLPIFALLLVFPANVSAQSRDSIPHISKISVESRNNLIRLSWTDSPAAKGPVYIFRSARPFVSSIPANIMPVTVRYGQEYFIDDTDDLENIHYFIAASDTSGRRYDIILPQVNSTGLNYIHDPNNRESASLPARETRGSSSDVSRGISNIAAKQEGERVIITYDASGQSRNAILYRSIQPLRQVQDLLNAVIVQSRITSPFIDLPVPGISWYYAVIFEDEISSGNLSIRPGVNATVTPVTIAVQDAADRTLRPIPLPILTLRNTMPEGFFQEIPEQIPLSTASADLLNKTRMPQKIPLALKGPRVFAVDLQAPTGGEESALFQIISEYFIKFDWKNALAGLRHYLSLPRSKDIEARARFYLGQTLYYSGNHREALMEFLFFRAHHPAEAGSWINAVLAAMVY